MLISIIVPVFNNERKIERCIKSILSQTFPRWELILVNDGSTDKSGEICDNFAALDRRIKVYHTPNGGVSKARNLGLNVSRGEWVTFCDSDDELLPGALDSYYKIINDDIDLIRAGFLRIKDNTFVEISTTKSIDSDKEIIIEKCNNSGYEAYIWNSCFRNTLVKSIRFNESITWCEDHLFTFLSISKSRSVAFISEIVYKYYAPTKDNSFSTNNLSTRYIEPNLIITEAIEERNIKIEMCKRISKNCLMIIEKDFDYKVNLALRYAVVGNKLITGLNISTLYSYRHFMRYISLIIHLKLYPYIRRFAGLKSVISSK